MIEKIAYFLIFGKPLLFYTGIITIFSFWFTALIGFLNFKGYHVISFKWHPRMAIFSISLSIIHAILGLSAYFNI